MNETSPTIREKAPIILAEIKKAKSILLHCHPLPDPDSVGSVLAMKFILESMGKKAVIIRGDSEMPRGFMHFPGIGDIIDKNFSEIDRDAFDLFISVDSGSLNMISQDNPPTIPLPFRTIVIDHHVTNESYGDINLIDPTSPAAAFIIFQLAKSWGIVMTPEIAINLFMGICTDTGGFKYPPTDYRVLAAASELAKVAPDFTESIFVLENSMSKESIYFQAIALNSIETFLNDSLAVSTVSNEDLMKKGIPDECIRGISISNILKSVIGWNIGVSLIERKPNKVKVSLRTRDKDRYDVSKLAAALGGGGHRAAAAAVLNMPLDEAKKLVVSKAKELYNL